MRRYLSLPSFPLPLSVSPTFSSTTFHLTLFNHKYTNNPSFSVLSCPQVVIAKEVIYNPAIVAIKTSILLLYRRVFTERCYNSSFNMTLWCTGAFVLSYSICQAVLTVFYCTPVAALWDHRIKGAKCIDFDVVLIVLSSLNIGTDILILCLPVPQLWKLTMSTRQKCQLTGIFSLGGLFAPLSLFLSLSPPSTFNA